jgi:PAS domain S-box-containing protein
MDEGNTYYSSDVADWELQDVRWWFAAIVDSSNDAIISKNLDGVISTWNRAAERLFGYSAEEAIGRPITVIIPPELHDEEQSILRRLRAGERIENYETRRVTRHGRYLNVSLTISPVKDAGGTVIGASKILRDITASKRIQAALRESEHRLASEVAGARTLHAISTRLISESTPESLFAQILDAAIELMGADASSIQMLALDGKSLTLVGCKNFHVESAQFWQRVTAEMSSACGRALRMGERVLVSDVERCEVMAGTQDLEEYRRSAIRAVQSTPLRSRSGRPLGMISTHWRTAHTPTSHDFTLFDVLARQAADLIERVLAEEAVRESEQRFRLIANSAPVNIWMTDTDDQCTFVNQQSIDFTGRPSNSMLGKGWTKGIHPDDRERSWNTYEQAAMRREPFQMEYRFRRHDGEYRWILATGRPRYNSDGSFAGYIGSAVDVTERKLAEEAMSTISQRLIEAQENERTRIGRELHDDINQRVALLGARLDALRHDPGLPTKERQKIDEAHQQIVGLLKDIQALSHRLHPPQLEVLGIVDASAALCREIASQHGVDVHFHAERVPPRLSTRIGICLYRVLQEALHNAIKHSGTKAVDVVLSVQSNQIELRVDDRGIGFDPEAIDGRGLGLASMKERLKAIKGQLAIRSYPQRGTSIEARVPLLNSPRAY